MPCYGMSCNGDSHTSDFNDPQNTGHVLPLSLDEYEDEEHDSSPMHVGYVCEMA